MKAAGSTFLLGGHSKTKIGRELLQLIPEFASSLKNVPDEFFPRFWLRF